MIRRLICMKCTDTLKPLHGEDVQMGCVRRTRFVSTQVPKGHGMTINGVFSPIHELVCDYCSELITGVTALAITDWNKNREGTPGCWEAEYGTLLPVEAVIAERKLST